jgi:uncharacterized protein (DUF952 family)
MGGTSQISGDRPKPVIFHIAAERDWIKTISPYRGDTLGTQGFIHCSTAEQLTPVANRFFRGRQDLIVLVIDQARVRCRVVYENLEGGSDLFPHIYGPLDHDAVVATLPLKPVQDGSFELPADLAKWGVNPLESRSKQEQ